MSGGQSLTVVDVSDSEVMLDYTDMTGKTSSIAFNLQYYNRSNGTFEGEATLPSGAYIFKPKMDD